MAVKTYAVQLEEVQTVIAAVETKGQAYTIDGRSQTRADLSTLYDREKWLRAQAARETTGGVRTRYGTPKP